MIREKIAPEFYIEDHALIYGLLGKYAEEARGEAGLDALAKGTILYSRERGIRMAKRALADGRELNMQTYLLYGEWADTRKMTSIQVSGIVPDFLNTVPQCAWNDSWLKYGLGKYGAVYCTHCDKNLVRASARQKPWKSLPFLHTDTRPASSTGSEQTSGQSRSFLI